VDPRTPVIVGAGQVTHRPSDDGEPTPLGLMVTAAHTAAQDAGSRGEALLASADAVGVVDLFSWTTGDPAAMLAHELGVDPHQTFATARGGTSPVTLLGAIAADIANGDVDVALIAGGEAVTPFMRAVRAGQATGWPVQPNNTKPSRMIGTDREPHHPAEFAAGLIAPVFWYPVFEQALRGAQGQSPAEHTEQIARLWARFAAVAVDNPYAWTRNGPDAAEIATPTPDNRLVSAPYTKLMNANIQVDQGAALLVCSAGAAEAAGIPRDRWVFVSATATATDHWHPGERDVLHRSPAIAACGQAVLGHSGVGIDDVALLDLYSCFPSAVQIAAQELGIDLGDSSREPTVTGGLTFAGGPANNYVMHSLATLVGRLRGGTGELGLATAVGWYLTKHATALLSSSPPPKPFAALDVQDQVDGLPSREIAADTAGTGVVESYTAIYDRDGTATIGVVSALMDDGRRALAKSQDAGTLDALLRDDPLGMTATLDGAAGFTLV
jgi:acetyl-CoA C-acetyltransferase